MMNKINLIAHKFEDFINLTSKQILENNRDKELDYQEPENSDSIAEILEKLIINSIRVWRLEDLAKEYENNNEELGKLKKKIDFCFKNVRPKLINALNKLFHNSVVYNQKFETENVKLYKGYKN